MNIWKIDEILPEEWKNQFHERPDNTTSTQQVWKREHRKRLLNQRQPKSCTIEVHI